MSAKKRTVAVVGSVPATGEIEVVPDGGGGWIVSRGATKLHVQGGTGRVFRWGAESAGQALSSGGVTRAVAMLNAGKV